MIQKWWRSQNQLMPIVIPITAATNMTSGNVIAS